MTDLKTYAVEIREIPSGVIQVTWENKSDNIYIVDDHLTITGSFSEIIKTSLEFIPNKIITKLIGDTIHSYKNNETVVYKIGNKVFDFRYAYLMGILNVTPDSFSDGGKFTDRQTAVNHALNMIQTGADIIDIGGESSRPGSDTVSGTEELDRVMPVIKEILNSKPETVISIDTTKANVAYEALKSGALIVNDISGGTFEQEILDVVKDFNSTIVLMHIQGKPKTMQDSPEYNDVVSEVYDFLHYNSQIANQKGISKIIIDPGIGFGKRTVDNLRIIERLEDFKSLGFPILIGLSRKSFIGNILNLPLEDRDNSTNAFNAFSISNGARIIRTHNTEQAVQTCKLFNSMISN